jgi:hypothetical protein
MLSLLNILFAVIALVDTDSIDPKDLDIFVISKATQRITEISSYQKMLTFITNNWMSIDFFAPFVRQSFVI